MHNFIHNLIIFLVVGVILFAFVGTHLLGVRFDYQAGSHKIIPTAVDQDFWNNYIVYYRTTAFMKDEEEKFYYIHRDNKELAQQVRDVILDGHEIFVHYDRYIGVFGIRSPKTSPIVRIDIIDIKEE